MWNPLVSDDICNVMAFIWVVCNYKQIIVWKAICRSVICSLGIEENLRDAPFPANHNRVHMRVQGMGQGKGKEFPSCWG